MYIYALYLRRPFLISFLTYTHTRIKEHDSLLTLGPRTATRRSVPFNLVEQGIKTPPPPCDHPDTLRHNTGTPLGSNAILLCTLLLPMLASPTLPVGKVSNGRFLLPRWIR